MNSSYVHFCTHRISLGQMSRSEIAALFNETFYFSKKGNNFKFKFPLRIFYVGKERL